MQSYWDCFKWIVILPRIKNLFLFFAETQLHLWTMQFCFESTSSCFCLFFLQFFQLFFASTFLSAHLHRFRKLPSRWKRKTRFVENKSLEHFYFGHFSSKFFKIYSFIQGLLFWSWVPRWIKRTRWSWMKWKLWQLTYNKIRKSKKLLLLPTIEKFIGWIKNNSRDLHSLLIFNLFFYFRPFLLLSIWGFWVTSKSTSIRRVHNKTVIEFKLSLFALP